MLSAAGVLQVEMLVNIEMVEVMAQLFRHQGSNQGYNKLPVLIKIIPNRNPTPTTICTSLSPRQLYPYRQII